MLDEVDFLWVVWCGWLPRIEHRLVLSSVKGGAGLCIMPSLGAILTGEVRGSASLQSGRLSPSLDFTTPGLP